ncbi:MAG: hypothetical protein ACX931_12535 [Saccharospirillum sp.]
MPIDRALSALKSLLFLLALASLVWLLLLSDGEGFVSAWVESNDWPVYRVVAVATVLYILMLAIPFFPAVEFGWLVMAAFGTVGILAIWLVTPVGVLLAYGMGYWLRDWHWVAALRQRIAALPDQPPESRRQRALQWVLKRLASHPYLMLVVLINLPGNWMIGGGGGIGLLSGASGLYRPWWFVLVLIPATGFVALAMLLGLELRTG